MTDFREEAYILEKMEITDDDVEDDFKYEEIKDSGDEQADRDSDDDDDLNNFDALKAKTNFKMQSRADGESMKTYKPEPKPRTVERDVVIDDFVRNFLQKFSMGKTLNIF